MLLPDSTCLLPVLPAVLWTATLLLHFGDVLPSSSPPPAPPHDRHYDLRTFLYDGAGERLAPHTLNLTLPHHNVTLPQHNFTHPPHSPTDPRSPHHDHVPKPHPLLPPPPLPPHPPAPARPRSKRLAKPSPSGALNFTWPAKRVVVVEGDVVLGGLMMVHERHNDLVCGPIMPQGGVQALEAMLYTLDFINDQEDFIPGVRLGAHILDDCDKDTYGLEQAVDFIKGRNVTAQFTSRMESYRLY
ncbi:RNA-binding protein 12-like [Penaeus chinensis]|uniref:RNA-binding protein 12-like n=1 Tax=Penaeus chinensis TaxID=139456 RepID=UPI001FB5DE59|nr:RNA-binding protein 12-like [Penaeus chinensis]